ncbi:MAG TPA: VCBS repeat-containing protein [Cyclobacteriaceae bacterium]|nr:VCBS repeat-containing protein [Cyclobacteriaceae bacterium]
MFCELPIRNLSFAAFFAFFTLSSCNRPGERPAKLFEELLPETTGISFSNIVKQAGENNVLNYPYYFNGGGVAAGDINNDGLVDLYFTGNQVQNKLYLNKGNFVFEDITDKAGVSAPVGWKTGVTMADINHDGLLDIYVCRSALSDSVQRQNLLFINNGNLTFTERAKDYDVADDSYSTHASFFDYDRDGDLDLFVLNHSLPQYAGFSRLLGDMKKQKASKFGSKLYRNDGGKFHDVTGEAGLINNVLSFGLGLAVSDIDLDGWLDLYISNDFNEEDYLYMNQHDGTFVNVIKEATGHVSLFSMGSDVADINNDALPDIFTLDMMPETNERIKLSSGDDNYDKYKLLVDEGFHHQSMRNMLQLNNGNGTFSEIGQLAGISNTDWSWAALFSDFDGDGWKDLFVSNGYEKDYTNMQFLKFTVDEQIKARQTGTSPDIGLILDRMPAIEVGNYFFRNNGDLTFTKTSEAWGLTRKFKSNGSAYADLDNDGDPDLLINVMNGAAAVYRNETIESSKAKFLKIDLTQEVRPITGTKIFCYAGSKKQYYEFSPNRGFQSCLYTPLEIGLGNADTADSVRIIWPDGKTKVYQRVSSVLIPKYAEADDGYHYAAATQPLFTEVETIHWKHSPPVLNDFKRQFLLPKMFSYSGPKLVKGDVNGDQQEDIYVCGPNGQAGSLFVQSVDGVFLNIKTTAFERDMDFQDEDGLFFDADNDGDLDLYVVSGGYMFDEKDKRLQDRLYINDGKGNFVRSVSGVPDENLDGASVVTLDLDGDGDLDLFTGSRMVPGKYPIAAPSLILFNDGKGTFSKSPNNFSPALKNAGMVCATIASDLNHDDIPELIVAGEWMSLKIFSRRDGNWIDDSQHWFAKGTNGWWNCLLAEDFDQDGDIDLIAGNYGLNSQFRVSPEKPSTLIYKDFDGDNQVDPFFSYFVGDKSYPFASRDEALGQVPFLKPRFTDYNQYANASLKTMFKKKELNDAVRLSADGLSTMYFENKGNQFETKPLPVEVQFSPVYAMTCIDVDNDGDKDVVVGGNESNVRVRIGRTDANRGVILLNDGKGNFSCLSQRRVGLNVKGDVRGIVNINGQLIFGINNEQVRGYKLNKN